ncbi:fibronectin-like [Argopecten irradians]|uniref:fibronectin-like n=1 Tax=Argopecten irradians TaxID=31199 RepID=UPI00371AE7F0
MVTTQEISNIPVTAPATFTGQVRRYDVTWSEAGSGTRTGTTAKFVQVTGLQSATTYNFYIKSIESGSWTAAQEVTTTNPITVTTKSLLGDTCTVSNCADPNAVCSTTTCVCKSGFYDIDGDTTNVGEACTAKLALSVSCNSVLTGVVQCSDTNAECTSTGGNVCRCQTGYFDSNGYNTPGGTCTSRKSQLNNGLYTNMPLFPVAALKVTSVTATSVTTTGVTISWTESATPSQVSSYTVVWRLSGNTAVEGSSPVGKVTSTVITGLSQSTMYEFKVISFESGSRSSAQQIESDASVIVTTMSGLVVTSLSVGVEGTSTVTIAWNAPSPGVDQVRSYEVHWTPELSNGTSAYNAAKTTSVRLTGFVSGQMYSFSVKSIEDGSRRNPQEVQTSGTSITINAGLTVGCGVGINCADSNSECVQDDAGTTTVCRCKSGYFDSNGYSTAGGMCVTMSALAVTDFTQVKEGTDTVNISWTPPTEYTDQVNRYLLFWSPPTTINGNSVYDGQPTTAVQLVGFTPGQIYTFFVRSVESGSLRYQEQYTQSSASPITMMLSWTLPSGIKTSYDVITTPSLTPTTTTTESITYSTGVIDGQRYNISITTVSVSERSDPLVATFRTVSKISGSEKSDPLVATFRTVSKIAGVVTTNAGLTVGCGVGINCADSNSECVQDDGGTTTVCRCISGYFDSNGYSTAGGMCVTMSTLAVTGITLVKVGTDTVNISWTPPTEYTDQVNSYRVSWSPATIINGNSFYDAQLTTAVQLVGFTPGQTFTFSVSSVESGSLRNQDQSTQVSTSPITICTVSGSERSDPLVATFRTVSKIHDTESITYSTGVIDGQRYNISITTVSGSERSDPLVATFRTVSKTPDPPTSLTCHATTDQSITLSWTAPSLPRGDIQYYVVQRVDIGALFTTTSSTTEYTVASGLQAAMYYTFNIATVNDAVTETNQSSFSSMLGCATKAASK